MGQLTKPIDLFDKYLKIKYNICKSDIQRAVNAISGNSRIYLLGNRRDGIEHRRDGANNFQPLGGQSEKHIGYSFRAR